MKYIILALFILSAQAKKTDLLVHNKKMNIVEKRMDISDILTGTKTENKHFKVTLSTSEEAIDLDDNSIDQFIRVKAASVLFHLVKAKRKLAERLSSPFINNLPKVTIRIEMEKAFSPFSKYVEDEANDNFNNSVTIPADGFKKFSDVESWQNEIWFRPYKKIEIDNMVTQVSNAILEGGNDTGLVLSVANDMSQSLMTEYALTEAVSSGTTSYHLDQLMVSFVSLRVFPLLTKLVSKPFKGEFFLDTAAMPAIVYHEFVHLALSDEVSVHADSLIGEGYANYFTSVVSGSIEIASKAGKYGANVGGYDGKFSYAYRAEHELKGAEHNGFVYSLLIGIRDSVAKVYKDREKGLRIADQVIYESRKYLSYNNSPVKDLTGAIIKAVKKSDAKKKRQIIMSIQRTAHKFGI